MGFYSEMLNILLRIAAFMIGAGHIVGYFGFAKYYDPWIVVHGISLLALSVTPISWVKRNSVLFMLMGFVTALSYFVAGLPFLDEKHDMTARSIFLAEFIALMGIFIVVTVRFLYTRSRHGSRHHG